MINVIVKMIVEWIFLSVYSEVFVVSFLPDVAGIFYLGPGLAVLNETEVWILTLSITTVLIRKIIFLI